MRIGFDAKRAFHNQRGLGNYSRTLLESLGLYFPEEEYYLFTPPIVKGWAKSWSSGLPDFKIIEPQNWLGRKFSSSWRSLALSNVLNEYHLDIYHGLSHELPPKIRNLDCKKVVTIHDLIYLRFPEFFPLVDRKVYDYKFRYSVKAADRVISICQQTTQDLIEFFRVPEDKISLVYQSCDPSFYKAPPVELQNEVMKKYNLEHRPYLLYVGAIEPRKNARSIVKAFARIKDKFPRHQLVFIGQGNAYKEELKKEILHQGLHERCHIFDRVLMSELPSFYHGAEIFVFPSFFEGFGIPIIESLFCRTPVITSQGGCFPEAGGDGCLYTDPHNLETITEAMDFALSDEKERHALGERGRQYVERFHWKKTSQNLMNVYQDLISQ